jgi:hypothetical protein
MRLLAEYGAPERFVMCNEVACYPNRSLDRGDGEANQKVFALSSHRAFP